MTSLYTPEILRLATNIPWHQRLPSPMITITRQSPICGSRITIDLITDLQGRITAFGQEVRACALGQAAAAIITRPIIGTALPLVSQGHNALTCMLDQHSYAFPDLWEPLTILAPAAPFKARHPSILLAFDAIKTALIQLQKG